MGRLWARTWLQISLVMLIGFSLPTVSLRADEIWAQNVRALAEKMSSAAKDMLREPSSEPHRGGDFQELMVAQKVRAIGRMIDRGEVEQIERALAEVEPEFDGQFAEWREEWRAMAAGLRADLPGLRERLESAWRSKVDDFVEVARRACLQARGASELEMLLIQFAPLELRPLMDESPLADRGQEKLVSARKAVKIWMGYLDEKNAGNIDAASQRLKELLPSPSAAQDFPVFTRSEISERLSSPLPEGNVNTAILAIFESIKQPADIPTAVQRAYQMQRQGLEFPPADLMGLQVLQTTWHAMEEGAPLTWELPPASAMGSGLGGGYLARWRMELFRLAVLRLAKQYGESASQPEESGMAVLSRLIDRFYRKGDFEVALKLMRMANDASLMDNGWPMYQAIETSGVERLLGARRLEAAGEVAAAAAQYRAILSTTGKYYPYEEAAAALKRLHAAHANLLDDYGALALEQLTRLQNAVRNRVR